MSTQVLQVPAIRFTQRNRVFYTTAIPAKHLIRLGKVDVFDAEAPPEEAGYQRAPSATRLKDVATFIEKDDAVLPIGGLLNARSAEPDQYGSLLTFRPSGPALGPNIEMGVLTVPDVAESLFIVDMQHRIKGLEWAMTEDERTDIGEFPVVCTIADGLTRHEEIEQFELINTTQKKVATDLARRLLSMQLDDVDAAMRIDERGKRWEARGPNVVTWLMAHSEVWGGMIIPPNKSKRQMHGALTKETSFVSSLKPILETPAFQRTPDDQIAELIDRYWQAVRKTWPLAFRDPKANVIYNTSGIFPLHRLMPEIFEHARAGGQSPTVDRMAIVMRVWRDELGDNFWARDNEQGAARYGTSMGAFARIAARLRALLPELDLML